MADKFPPELIRHIVANLGIHHDAATLKAASLASSMLRGPCQERLFSILSLVGAPRSRSIETPCLRLLRRFHQSEVLATYVKTVDIHGHDAEWFADDFLAKLLSFLADVGLVKKFRCGVMDFKWVKPPLDVQEAVTQLILSPSMQTVELEGVPMEILELGNPNLKALKLLSAMDHPHRSVFAAIRSEESAAIEVLSISQSQSLVAALMKPGSGVSWGSLRELSLKADLMHSNISIPDLPLMLTTVATTLEVFQFETDLLRAPNGPIDLSMLTNLRQLAILNSPSLIKMLGIGIGFPQNPFVESLHDLLSTVTSKHLHAVSVASGMALRAAPDGNPVQSTSWDIDFEIDSHKAWANLAETLRDKARFPALKEFVVQGWGLEEGIRKYLPHLDQTGLLVVDSCSGEMAMGGFQVVSVSHGPGPHGHGPPPHSHGHGPPPHSHGPPPNHHDHGHGHSHGPHEGHDHHGHGHDHGYDHGHSHDHGYVYGYEDPSHDHHDHGYFSDGQDYPHYGHGHGPLN